MLAHRILWSVLTMGLLVVLLLATRASAGDPRRPTRHPPVAGGGRGDDHLQLGDLHLRGQQQPGRRDLARVLHQPAGHRADGGLHPGRDASPTAVGCAGRGFVAVWVLSWDYGRPPWLALVLAFSFGTYGLAKKSADVGAVESLAFETAAAHAVRGGLHRLAVGHRQLELRRARRRSRAARRQRRHRHRRPVDLLRRRRHPRVDGLARPVAVPRADPPVRPRPARLPRGHDPRSLGRVPARLVGPRRSSPRGGPATGAVSSHSRWRRRRRRDA